MAGQQWEYGTAAVRIQTGASGDLTWRLVMIETRGGLPAHEKTAPDNLLQAYLVNAGDDGWELTSTSGQSGVRFLIFKRPKGWMK